MRRSTPAVTALTGAALALALTACGGAARQQASGPAHVSLAAAQAPAETGVSAASGSKAAAPAAAAPASAGARSTTGSSGRSKHGNGGSGKSAASSSASAATSTSGSTAATTQQTVQAAGTGGGGGGGKVAPVPPPADWPATVPIPAGKITAASGAVSHWTINITVKGVDTVVIAKLVALYQSKGFVLDPAFNNPKVLHRNRLTMTIFWRNRDHGPEATEVLLVLDKR